MGRGCDENDPSPCVSINGMIMNSRTSLPMAFSFLALQLGVLTSNSRKSSGHITAFTQIGFDRLKLNGCDSMGCK